MESRRPFNKILSLERKMDYKSDDQIELDKIIADWKRFLENGKIRPTLNELENFPDGIVISNLVKHAGAYGAIGIFEFSTRPNIPFVYKISTEPGFNLRHEMANLDILRGSREWCPHFCESYGMVNVKVDPEGGSLFKDSDTAIKSDVALMEFIPGDAFSKSIADLSHDQIVSVLQQTLLAVDIMQTKFQMTHYDLHTSNVMLICCHPDTVFVYKWKGRTFVIPTRGVVPVIIDFGFAYSNLLEGRFYGLMSFTNDGCLGCQTDEGYDARVFLIDTVDELERLDKYRSLQTLLRDIYPAKSFDPRTGEEMLDFDPKSGRGNDKFNPATKRVEDLILDIEEEKKISNFLVDFVEADSDSGNSSDSESKSRSRSRSRSSRSSESSDRDVYYNCTYLVELIQSLQEYPLKLTGTLKTHYKDFRAAYIAFAKQFVHYEKTVKTNFLRFLILRNIVDAAHRALQEEKGVNETFRKTFFMLMNESCKFYTPPSEVDVDILLKSMVDMSKIIVNGISQDLKMINRKRTNRYRIQTLEIFDRVETRVDQNFNVEGPIYIWDIDQKKKSSFQLTNEQLIEIKKMKRKSAGLIRILEKHAS